MVVSTFTSWGATFPLAIPTRPTSFPLKRPIVTGTVVAWGDNRQGQANVPVGLRSVVAVAAGQQHTVALKNDGTVVAWGANGYGQVTVPKGLTDVVAVAAGTTHTVALKSDGTVVTWGLMQGVSSVPDLVNVVAIAAGLVNTVALKSDGTVVTWGRNESGQADVPLGLNGVVGISAGAAHTVAVVSDEEAAGRVVSWGQPRWGQPNTVPGGLSGVVATASGNECTLALKTDGKLIGWGLDAGGQLSGATGLSNIIAIAMSGDAQSSAVGLRDDGTVVAWGNNDYGQTNLPAGLTEVVAIAKGPNHTVALRSDGLVGPQGASGKAQVVSGFMVSIAVTRGGHGYTTPPLVVIRGGGGTGATATAILTDGSVTGFTVTNAGIGYTSVPEVLIASPPSASEVSISVSRVNVDMKVILGRKYQLQSSNDLKVWALVGPPFVADSERMTQEFVIAETGRYFQLVEVP